MEHTIDATGKKLGRIAAEAASFLVGKKTPTFAKNKVIEVKVEILNASKLSIDEKKKKEKVYSRYSGYPGGLKQEKMEAVILKKGHKEIVKEAVWGMLPKNKLRTKRFLNLIVKN